MAPLAASPVTQPNTDQTTAVPSRRRWPDLVLFLVVAFLGAGVLGALQPVLGIDPVVIQIVQFAPALGAGVVALRYLRRGRSPVVIGWRLTRDVWWRLGAAVLGVGAIAATAAGTYAVTGGDLHVTAPGTLAQSFLLVVVAQFVGACGEEIGWRCFLQPYLRGRFGVLVAGLVVGLVWAAWHPQMFTEGVLVATCFTVMAVAMSVFLSVLLSDARGGNLLIAGAFHALVNLMLLLMMNEEGGATAPWLVLAAGGTAVALVAVTARAVHRRRGPVTAGG